MAALNDAIGDRITQRRKELDLTREQLAHRLGVSTSTVQAHENGRNALKPDALLSYARVLRCSPLWILSGTDEDLLSGTGLIPASELSVSNDLPMVPVGDVIDIPIYDIRASAGAGALVSGEDVDTYQPFREEQLSAITATLPKHLAIIQVSGDSMWSTLHNGDQVLVDRTVDMVRKDGIYILEFRGELLVKRCQRNLANGTVRVKSDNPDYDTFDVAEDDMLRVLGRVVWIGRALG